MFAQFVPVLSVLLFILNVPLPLLQNDPIGDPNGKDELPYVFTVDPIEYLLYVSVFGNLGAT